MAKKAKAKQKVNASKHRFDAKRAVDKPKRPAAPRDVVLPGMEQVRNIRLDNICTSIAETRADQNRLRGEEAGLEQMALRVMREDRRKDPKGIFSYRHAGVELVRLVGDEKLRVRTSRDNATAEVQDDETEPELGTGQGVEGLPLQELVDDAEDAGN
ncbi:MAG: hypothetical protein OEV65_17375 [Aquincola sp.]|nr:hypothetical protein [Aquincola sp.]